MEPLSSIHGKRRLILAAIFVAGFSGFSWARARFIAHKVTVEKVERGWTLRVDGQDFQVKGVGAITDPRRIDMSSLTMAKDMGANAVRAWGKMPRKFLDRAADLGLMVNQGLWLEPVRGVGSPSYRDAATRWKMERDILAYVRAFKNHPALLCWTLGNETFAFTNDPSELEWLGRFYAAVAEKIRDEDPHHPIVYACSGVQELERLTKVLSVVDIVGLNTYSNVRDVTRWLERHDIDKPVLVTEFGTALGVNRPKDGNNLPLDKTDTLKARDYESMWKKITASTTTLGGFAFTLGEQRNQDSLTWHNLNYGKFKRQAFWALRFLYTGQPAPNACPVITRFKPRAVTDLEPGETFSVFVYATDADNDPLTYEFFLSDVASDALKVQKPRVIPLERVGEETSGRVRLRLPKTRGVFRLYVCVKDSAGNAAIANQAISIGQRNDQLTRVP